MGAARGLTSFFPFEARAIFNSGWLRVGLVNEGKDFSPQSLFGTVQCSKEMGVPWLEGASVAWLGY